MPPKKTKPKILERYFLTAAAPAPEEKTDAEEEKPKRKKRPVFELKEDIDDNTKNQNNKNHLNIVGDEDEFPALGVQTFSKNVPAFNSNFDENDENISTEANDEDLTKYGIYFDASDGYDYNQHLRGINDFSFRAEDLQVKKSKKNKRRTCLPIQENEILETASVDCSIVDTEVVEELTILDELEEEEYDRVFADGDQLQYEADQDIDGQDDFFDPLLQEIAIQDDASSRGENLSEDEDLFSSSNEKEDCDVSSDDLNVSDIDEVQPDQNRMLELHTEFPTLSKANRTKITKKGKRRHAKRSANRKGDNLVQTEEDNLEETNNLERTGDNLERTEEDTNAFFDNINEILSGSEEESDEGETLDDAFYNMKIPGLSKADQKLLDNEFNAELTEEGKEQLMKMANSTRRSKDDPMTFDDWSREFEKDEAGENWRAKAVAFCKRWRPAESESENEEEHLEDIPEDITTREVIRDVNMPKIINFTKVYGKRRGLTAKAMKSHDAEFDHTRQRDDEAMTNQSLISILSVRPKDETPEERLSRKQAYKQYRRNRRTEKSETKELYKAMQKAGNATAANKRNCGFVSII